MAVKYKHNRYLSAISMMVLCALTVAARVGFAGSLSLSAERKNPQKDSNAAIKPKELIRKCAEYLESMPPYAIHTVTQAQYTSGVRNRLVYEQRWDGVRIDVTWKRYVINSDQMSLEYDKRGIWTGKQYQFRQQYFPPDGREPDPVQPSGSLDYALGKRLITSTYGGAFLSGILLGDKKNVGQVLLESGKLAIKEQMESVLGDECYVIEGRGPGGHYTIWIDPAHGFSVRKAKVEKKLGDLYGGTAIGARTVNKQRRFIGCLIELDNVEIKEVAGRYVPVSGTLVHSLEYSDGTTKQIRYSSRRSNIQFNPDFEAMGAFVMDGIRDGESVYIGEMTKVRYVWSNGRFILDKSYNSQDHRRREPRESPTKAGDKIPAFNIVTTDGDRISTTETKGKVLVLNFFTTRCGACRKELPYFESEIWGKSKDKGLIAICIGAGHSDEELREFKADNGYDVPMASDPQRVIYKNFSTGYIPRNVIVGRDGRIKYSSTGFNADVLARMIEVIGKQLRP